MSTAIIVGGSLSGLFAGVVLRSIGWDVEIYERSRRTLESQGGGLLLQPEVVELFRRVGLDADGPAGVWTQERIFLADDGTVSRTVALIQKQTSWNAMYRALRGAFPDDGYYPGFNLVSIDQGPASVVAHFDNGHASEGAVLIGADGLTSTVRHLLFPSVRIDYAGYVAWRGLVKESELDPKAADLLQDNLAFYELPDSHFVCYMVPDEAGGDESRDRYYNWVWYRPADEANELPAILTDRAGQRHASRVGRGHLALGVESELRAAAERLLCWPLRALLQATQQPFVQAIVDLTVPHMVQGRVALLGESAFVARPHTAASTGKAATNALTLAEALQTVGNVPQALLQWEPSQLRLGRNLVNFGQSLWRPALARG